MGAPAARLTGWRSCSAVAWCGDAAEPLPLQADACPDALGDGGGERGRRGAVAGEAERSPRAHVDAPRADAPAAAHVFGAEHGDRDDGDARLEREAADAALGLAEWAGAHARALREDDDAV